MKITSRQQFCANTYAESLGLSMYEIWQKFYKDICEMSVSFSGIAIPKLEGNHSFVVFMAGGLTYEFVWNLIMKKLAVMPNENQNLSIKDTYSLVDDRKPDYSYAIRVLPFLATDQALRGKSVQDLPVGIQGQTLMERLVHDLFVRWLTGGEYFLDQETETLCLGSRFDGDGRIPCIRYTRAMRATIIMNQPSCVRFSKWSLNQSLKKAGVRSVLT